MSVLPYADLSTGSLNENPALRIVLLILFHPFAENAIPSLRSIIVASVVIAKGDSSVESEAVIIHVLAGDFLVIVYPSFLESHRR